MDGLFCILWSTCIQRQVPWCSESRNRMCDFVDSVTAYLGLPNDQTQAQTSCPRTTFFVCASITAQRKHNKGYYMLFNEPNASRRRLGESCNFIAWFPWAGGILQYFRPMIFCRRTCTYNVSFCFGGGDCQDISSKQIYNWWLCFLCKFILVVLDAEDSGQAINLMYSCFKSCLLCSL